MIFDSTSWTITEILKMKWKRYGNTWILGDFDSDTHIAYNEVKITKSQETRNGAKFISWEIDIYADYYGEKGCRKLISHKEFLNLKDVKAITMDIIKTAYKNNEWKLKIINVES